MPVARGISAAVVCAVVAAVSWGVSAQAAPGYRPYLKDVRFVFVPAGEFEFEGQSVLEVVLANMGGGGRVRICVSGVCRNAPAKPRVVVSATLFGQRWSPGQTRTIVIGACNGAGCMQPRQQRLRVS